MNTLLSFAIVFVLKYSCGAYRRTKHRSNLRKLLTFSTVTTVYTFGRCSFILKSRRKGGRNQSKHQIAFDFCALPLKANHFIALMSSIGGGAPRAALRDGSSRYNAFNSRRRQSFGGSSDGETTPVKPRRGLLDSVNFRDASVQSTSLRASSAPRRSFGGDAMQTEAPIRDRRALLENWRKARAARQYGADDGEQRKRTRADPLLPPTSSRKVQRTTITSQENEDTTLSQNSNASQSTQFYDDESENGRAGSGLRSVRTPRSRRGKLGSARRHSMMGKNVINNAEGKFSSYACRFYCCKTTSETHCFVSCRAYNEPANI